MHVLLIDFHKKDKQGRKRSMILVQDISIQILRLIYVKNIYNIKRDKAKCSCFVSFFKKCKRKISTANHIKVRRAVFNIYFKRAGFFPPIGFVFSNAYPAFKIAASPKAGHII